MKDDDRQAEVRKYIRAYRTHGYGHLPDVGRQKGVELLLGRRPGESILLDVGCGRGEAMDLAVGLGYQVILGTEIVPVLCQRRFVRKAFAWDLPFPGGHADVVSCFDVLEHLLPGDEVLALREMARVADRRVVLTIADSPSSFEGENLHVNRRRYGDWHELIERECGPARMVPEACVKGVNCAWEIIL